ncbi:MAG: hypothetical protein N3F64_06985 [Nitrososphaeria archaeon]|nr:hypothetical protein [Nitrososphaeria archaeon]
MRYSLFLALIVALTIMLRLYPLMAHVILFSTDAWSPIRNTELLLEYSPIALDNIVMDGYNCYWPANSLFGAIFSQTLGLVPLKAMALIFPIIGSLTIIIFYVMVKRLFGKEVSLISSIIFALSFTHIIFTAAVTKETYANPLYMLLIFVFLADFKSKLLLFTLTSIGLVLAHHLTLFITIMVLFYMTVAYLVSNIRGAKYNIRLESLLLTILATVSFIYYILYAKEGFKITLTYNDFISFISYQILVLFLASYFTIKPTAKFMKILLSFTILPLSVGLMFLASRVPIMVGAPLLPSHYLLYAIPLIISFPLAILGSGHLKDVRGKMVSLIVFWASTILALEAYAFFGNSSIGLTLAYRSINYLWPPLAILSAICLYRWYRRYSRLNYKLAVALTILVVSLIAFINSYTVYATVSLEERYLGYFWNYRFHEFAAGAWVKSVYGGQAVAGDVKVSYMLKDYFSIKVDVLQGIKYIFEKASRPEILFLYHQMYRNGFVVAGGYSLNLPGDFIEKVYNLNLIYSNVYETIYAR